MVRILFKQVYAASNETTTAWVLVLYNISANHFVAIPINQEKENNSDIYIESIKRWANVSVVKDYNKSSVLYPIYINGTPLKITNDEYTDILRLTYTSLISFLNSLNINIDNLSYIKWCKDKYILNNTTNNNIYIQNGVYWINFGINIGSEIRKLRPAILWRTTHDKKVWTVIPLTTKKRYDNYYFHCDLSCIPEGTAKIEDLRNISYKRIISPFFYKDKIVIINKQDYSNIISSIKRYYTFNN